MRQAERLQPIDNPLLSDTDKIDRPCLQNNSLLSSSHASSARLCACIGSAYKEVRRFQHGRALLDEVDEVSKRGFIKSQPNSNGIQHKVRGQLNNCRSTIHQYPRQQYRYRRFCSWPFAPRISPGLEINYKFRTAFMLSIDLSQPISSEWRWPCI